MMINRCPDQRGIVPKTVGALLMILLVVQNGESAVQLFEEDETAHFMGQGKLGE